MGIESKGVGPYPARITRLQDVARPVSVPKENNVPAKILQFQRQTTEDAAVINARACQNSEAETIDEDEVQRLLEGLPRTLAEAMVSGNSDPLGVHNLDPSRVRDLLED